MEVFRHKNFELRRPITPKFLGERVETGVVFGVGGSFSDVDDNDRRRDFFDDFNESVVEFAGKIEVGDFFCEGRGRGEIEERHVDGKEKTTDGHG